MNEITTLWYTHSDPHVGYYRQEPFPGCSHHWGRMFVSHPICHPIALVWHHHFTNPKKNFLEVDLCPSFPVGKNRYVLLVFTFWGKKSQHPEIYSYWLEPAIAIKSVLNWDWPPLKRYFTGVTIWSRQHHKKCTLDRNLLVMIVTHSRCAHTSYTREPCACSRKNRGLPGRVHRD